MSAEHHEFLMSEDVIHALLIDLGMRERTGQTEMLRLVEKTQADSSISLIQAGTGTGKSFAYLIPALLNAVQQGDKTVVSTATLALQRQIMVKDGPSVQQIIKKITDVCPQLAVLKGWHNYVCRYKLEGGYPNEVGTLFDLENIESLKFVDSRSDYEESKPGAYGQNLENMNRAFSEDCVDSERFSEQLKRIHAWINAGGSGDRDDLVPGVSDRVWRNVSVPSTECIKDQCPFWRDCFAAEARTLARTANVVITNHAVLAVETQSDTGILPNYDHLIIDEAHALVDRITSQAGKILSISLWDRVVRRARRAGALVDNFERAGENIFEILAAMPKGRNLAGGWPSELEIFFHAADLEVRELISQVRIDSGTDAQKLALAQVAVSSLTDISQILQMILSEDLLNGDLVAWISEDSEIPQLQIAPLDVAKQIATQLFTECSVVLTSATLFPGGSAQAAAGNCGVLITDREWSFIDVGSPFDHRKQAMLYVAGHLPAPSASGLSELVLEELINLVSASRGGALCLFTSLRAVEQAAERIREVFDFPVYVQGDDQLPTLVEKFKNDESACLCGTFSLWQGVDVPGSTSRLVVIDRIPFPRPNDPLFSARSERVQKEGGNGFYQVSLVQASLLLAQGVGRILRSENDRGVVAILDSRIRHRSYGNYILRSLPPMFLSDNHKLVMDALKRMSG